MDDYAGRVLADRYRLPLPPSDAFELVETRAFDTYSGQEVLVRQVPLPEVVDAEVLDADGLPSARRATGRTVRRSTDPAVRRAIEAAQAAAQVPDHPRLDQVFDVFAEAGSLWIVSELVAARPLAALLAERPLNPYRAAEIGSDVLTALRVLHAHGWTHRNITVRTVLVCDDGRVVLTGLAAGAAEEALCGYVPAPRTDPDEENAYGPPAVESGPTGPYEPPAAEEDPYEAQAVDAGPYDTQAVDAGPHDPQAVESGPYGYDAQAVESGPYEPPAVESGPYEYDAQAVESGPYEYDAQAVESGPYEPPSSFEPGAALPGPGAPSAPEALPAPRPSTDGVPSPAPRGEIEVAPPAGLPAAEPGAGSAAQLRAARAGAIAAYRAGARAAARAGEDRKRAEHDRDDGPAEVADADGREQRVVPPAAGLPQLPAPWSRAADDPYAYAYDEDEDEGDEDDDEGPGPTPPGRRVHLAGTWGDGPGSGRPVPAGGSGGPGRSGEDALRADARRLGSGPAERQDRLLPQPVAARTPAGGWDEVVAGSGTTPAYRGPATPLAAERARQARIAVVGAVTERWAPEQAGPVHDNWQLAPPIGPSTDLWALGALLYRAVQGHAPYPEENAAELVQMVCGEPPAFAEECGPLRPVVESLLRQDPTERPDFEELRGWLRSLVRSAPEPEAGADIVTLPPADATRLPVVRRRGELVRRRRGRGGAAHGRHRQRKPQRREQPQAYEQQEVYEKPPRAPREPKGPKVLREPQRGGRAPRRLGRLLLVLILLLMAAAIAYAVLFMPESDSGTGTGASPSGSAAPGPGSSPSGGAAPSGGPSESASSGSSGSEKPQTSRSAVALAEGYELRKDAEGFEIGVPKGWQRGATGTDRQIRYGSDGFTVLVVPGRDTVKANGSDPLDYQRTAEPELKPFRESSWATSTGLRRVDIGRQAMAEGQFTWQEGDGRQVYVRNLVMIVDGRYHIVQVIGPENERDKVSEIYEQAISTYRAAS
ncbi:protein kinase [Streptomyces sp. QL37]|uniref:protein kinase n=1 Tax=Streptomyces sp. QL37 TaxID=2093747 RepID=UPI000CF28833|nr:protein kinase [Streptomyces sp. QL37]PPQ59241.1 serine/threonine protein kinase [Streptomyces sp. QL37]